MRTIKDYILLYAKGLAMGAADIVPGVSGGTIAFISGIYEELLSSISSINPSLLQVLRNEGFKAVWSRINGNFLLVLFAGIATSILTLAKLFGYLLHHQPILVWAFFFGLILASILFVGKQISKWNPTVIVGLVLGAIAVVALSVLPPLSPSQSYVFLFFAGAIAVCAMILPGISGSFILLILGAYSTVLAAIGDRNILQLAAVGLGAVVGLLSFSKLLSYLLKKYNNTMLAVLTGFLVGSLWKIWPWKRDMQVFLKEDGVKDFYEVTQEYGSLSAFLRTKTIHDAEAYKTYIEANISPFTYTEINSAIDPQLLLAVVCCSVGFCIIFFLERFATKKGHV